MDKVEKIAHCVKKRENIVDIKLKDDTPFSKMLLQDCVHKGLSQAGFMYPTNFQADIIPLGKMGIDLLIQSKSGSGKTLIFTIILLETYNVDLREPQSLILVPTREIAVQLEHILNEIGKFCQSYKAVSAIGGLEITNDRKRIQLAKTVVGTPGRILHLIRSNIFNTSHIKLLILDEADKMCTKHFHEDVENIIKALPIKKQIIACSATFCNKLHTYFIKHMLSPLFVSSEKKITSSVGIKQYMIEIPEQDNENQEMIAKIQCLNVIFSKITFRQCIIFVEFKSGIETYRTLLENSGWPCDVISTRHNQKARLEIYKKFREFKTKILISTNIMSRGIDSENVNLVINLGVPDSKSTYLHRIGRAGRFGSYGIAITLINSKENKTKFFEILDNVKEEIKILKYPFENPMPDLWEFSHSNKSEKKYDVLDNQNNIEKHKEKDDVDEFDNFKEKKVDQVNNNIMSTEDMMNQLYNGIKTGNCSNEETSTTEKQSKNNKQSTENKGEIDLSNEILNLISEIKIETNDSSELKLNQSNFEDKIKSESNSNQDMVDYKSLVSEDISNSNSEVSYNFSNNHQSNEKNESNTKLNCLDIFDDYENLEMKTDSGQMEDLAKDILENDLSSEERESNVQNLSITEKNEEQLLSSHNVNKQDNSGKEKTITGNENFIKNIVNISPFLKQTNNTSEHETSNTEVKPSSSNLDVFDEYKNHINNQNKSSRVDLVNQIKSSYSENLKQPSPNSPSKLQKNFEDNNDNENLKSKTNNVSELKEDKSQISFNTFTNSNSSMNSNSSSSSSISITSDWNTSDSSIDTCFEDYNPNLINQNKASTSSKNEIKNKRKLISKKSSNTHENYQNETNYEKSFNLWTNIYCKQLKQIHDYTYFNSYVRSQFHHK